MITWVCVQLCDITLLVSWPWVWCGYADIYHSKIWEFWTMNVRIYVPSTHELANIQLLFNNQYIFGTPRCFWQLENAVLQDFAIAKTHMAFVIWVWLVKFCIRIIEVWKIEDALYIHKCSMLLHVCKMEIHIFKIYILLHFGSHFRYCTLISPQTHLECINEALEGGHDN